MLDVDILATLVVADGADPAQPGWLSAASGLVCRDRELYVIADDEHCLGIFDLSGERPGRLVTLFDTVLPVPHAARKAAKPDLEALFAATAVAGYPHGALMAVGSGSGPRRQRAAMLGFDADGALLEHTLRHVDLAPLYAPLRTEFGALNIEGAFAVDGAGLCLLQRGSRRSPVNACIGFEPQAVERWLALGGAAPAAVSTVDFDLGSIDGVPLCFTDGAALPGGGWVFSAAAEDTGDSYADGRCAGSAVGTIDAAGRLACVERLARRCKVEGIAALPAEAGALRLLLVTDADDRQAPALLLSATLRIGVG